MKIIATLKQMFLTKQPTVALGRWNIVYCDKQINKKIDLNNEDHGGTCNINNAPQYFKEINLNKIIFYENM
jgi:hypothetical protein